MNKHFKIFGFEYSQVDSVSMMKFLDKQFFAKVGNHILFRFGKLNIKFYTSDSDA